MNALKYLDEYRDAEQAKRLAGAIRKVATRPWTIMEVCGGQTHSIARYGIEDMLGGSVELLHGPGCPVCVTPLETIDRAHEIASRTDVIFCSFGDMLRVPGSRGDLLSRKAAGADIRVLYSPLDAVAIAEKNQDKHVVFFAIGFETTAPANAMAVWLAKQKGLRNFSVLASHVLVPPAMTAILEEQGNKVQAFLGPGHVCTVMGTSEYQPLVDGYRVPIVVTGFEPLDLLEGILSCVEQLEGGRAELEVQYGRAVRPDGNTKSKELISRVFEVCDRKWRGIGIIPHSGYRLRAEYHEFDAELTYDVVHITTEEIAACISGEILRGKKKPRDCPEFGRACTPESPLGATMVSSEGACAAYYAYAPLVSADALVRSRST